MKRLSSQILIVVAAVSLAGSTLAQDIVVSVDDVTHAYSDDILRAGYTHQIPIRYDLSALPLMPLTYWTGSNAFEIYSPDGADWGSFQILPGPLVEFPVGQVNYYLRHFNSPDGTTWNMTGNDGADPAGGSTGPNSRAGGYLANLSPLGDGGYVSGHTNDIAVTLEFETNVSDGMQTRHLCIDTANAVAYWEWSYMVQPLWDNGLGSDEPRCWMLCAQLNMPPVWETPDQNPTRGYCQDIGFQMVASTASTCPAPPMSYSFEPPYDNGDYGTIDPESGLWTLPAYSLPPGQYHISFLAFDGFDYTYPPLTVHLNLTGDGCDCCEGKVGNVNNSIGDEPTIGDISVLIDHLFILQGPIDCLPEADINQSGGMYPTPDDITIGDIGAMIDCLFIIGWQNCEIRDCIPMQ